MRTSVQHVFDTEFGDRMVLVAEIKRKGEKIGINDLPISKQEMATLVQVSDRLQEKVVAHLKAQNLAAIFVSGDGSGLTGLINAIGNLKANIGQGSINAAGLRNSAVDVKQKIDGVQALAAANPKLQGLLTSPSIKGALEASMGQLKGFEAVGKPGGLVISNVVLRNAGVTGATLDVKNAFGASSKILSFSNALKTGPAVNSVASFSGTNITPISSLTRGLVAQISLSAPTINSSMTPSFNSMQGASAVPAVMSQPSAPPSSSQPAASQPAAPQSSQPSTSEPPAKAPENNAPPAADAKEGEKRPEQIVQPQIMPLPMSMLQGVSSQPAGVDSTTTAQQPTVPATHAPAETPVSPPPATEAKAEEKKIVASQNENPISRPIVTLVTGPTLGGGDTGATPNAQTAPMQQPAVPATGGERRTTPIGAAPTASTEPSKTAVGSVVTGAGNPVNGQNDNLPQRTQETVGAPIARGQQNTGGNNQDVVTDKKTTSSPEKTPTSKDAESPVVKQEIGGGREPIKQQAILAGCAACGRCTDGSGCSRPAEITGDTASMNSKFDMG